MAKNVIKKTLDVPTNINSRIEAFVRANPATSFTLFTLQALEAWLEKPEIKVKLPPPKIHSGKKG